ncbi:IS66 family insertion sequence element accessory protein TnpB [Ferrimonas pelagia]|uniref:Transposase n=1 Tax=Ferrimonas pelagia TaxID=1177826 RepID=A0ABP9ESM0_9GAMM
MFPVSSQLTVTLVCGVTDMRKAIDGLSNTVSYELTQEPCSEQLSELPPAV